MGTTADTPEDLHARELRLAIVAARYNEPIITQLLRGAEQAWRALGGSAASLRIEQVPGAFELPLAARQFALSGAVDGVVALGCVIRGDTPHFEYVAGQCASGLQRVMLDTGVPIGFGVLTVENQAQAEERADRARLDKGGEALRTVVSMVRLLRRI